MNINPTDGYNSISTNMQNEINDKEKTINLEFDNNDINNEKKSTKTKRKNLFSKQEDEYLFSIVNTIGDKNWIEVSKFMKKMNFFRTSRQCRDRYLHYLNPKIKLNKEWTIKEEELLVQMVEKYGNKWKFLENIFPGRTEVSLRNHYFLIERKKLKRNISRKSGNIMSDSYAFLDHVIQKDMNKAIQKVQIKKCQNASSKNVDNRNNKKTNKKDDKECSIFDDSSLFSLFEDEFQYILF